MKRKTLLTVLGLTVIAGFVAFGAGAFKSNLTPYVSFEKARASASAVQVAGKLVEHSDRFDEASSRLVFTLENEHGQKMNVTYKGPKPGNFNEAIQVVAIGRFHDGALDAEKLLVKCPSKYQGLEEKAYPSRSS